jgi:hypothetical protein
MQYWWHHKTRHAPFGLSVALLLGFCGLLGLGLWHLFSERKIGLPEIVLPEAINTRNSPALVHDMYQTQIKDLLVRLDTPDATVVSDVEKGLFSVRVPKEKLDAHLAAVLAFNHLTKDASEPAKLVPQLKTILNDLLK